MACRDCIFIKSYMLSNELPAAVVAAASGGCAGLVTRGGSLSDDAANATEVAKEGADRRR